MAEVCSVKQMAMAIGAILDEYSDVVQEDLVEAVDEASMMVVRQLRNTSPKNSGDYAKSWSRTPNRAKGFKYSRIAYARAPHYRLTHLLEYGHEMRQGGHAEAQPHIYDAEQAGIADFERRLLEGLK